MWGTRFAISSSLILLFLSVRVGFVCESKKSCLQNIHKQEQVLWDQNKLRGSKRSAVTQHTTAFWPRCVFSFQQHLIQRWYSSETLVNSLPAAPSASIWNPVCSWMIRRAAEFAPITVLMRSQRTSITGYRWWVNKTTLRYIGQDGYFCSSNWKKTSGIERTGATVNPTKSHRYYISSALQQLSASPVGY